MNLDTIRQTAAQTWCFIRFLPQYIGHKVPDEYLPWQLFLLLRTIMDLVFAPMITEEATYALGALIQEHHEDYLKVI